MCKKLITLGREFLCRERKSESQDSKEIKIKKSFLGEENKKSLSCKKSSYHGHAMRKK